MSGLFSKIKILDEKPPKAKIAAKTPPMGPELNGMERLTAEYGNITNKSSEFESLDDANNAYQEEVSKVTGGRELQAGEINGVLVAEMDEAALKMMEAIKAGNAVPEETCIFGFRMTKSARWWLKSYTADRKTDLAKWVKGAINARLQAEGVEDKFIM